MMIPVKNVSEKDVTIWDGHTPYHIGPGCVEECPDNAYKLAIKHNDYKGKIETTDEGLTGFGEPVTEKVEEPAPPANPWDADDWDPTQAPEEELRAYGGAKNLSFAADVSEDDIRDIVVEHRMIS